MLKSIYHKWERYAVLFFADNHKTIRALLVTRKWL